MAGQKEEDEPPLNLNRKDTYQGYWVHQIKQDWSTVLDQRMQKCDKSNVLLQQMWHVWCTVAINMTSLMYCCNKCDKSNVLLQCMWQVWCTVAVILTSLMHCHKCDKSDALLQQMWQV